MIVPAFIQENGNGSSVPIYKINWLKDKRHCQGQASDVKKTGRSVQRTPGLLGQDCAKRRIQGAL